MLPECSIRFFLANNLQKELYTPTSSEIRCEKSYNLLKNNAYKRKK